MTRTVRRVSLRRRAFWGMGVLGVTLGLTVAGAGLLIVDAADEFQTGLADIRDRERLVSDLIESVLRELYYAHLYLTTGDDAAPEAFRVAGFESHALYSEILRRNDAPEAAAALAPILEDLAESEALLARAQILADLGQDSASQADLSRAMPYTRRISEALGRLDEVNGAELEGTTGALIRDARRVAIALPVIMLAGFVLALIVAAGLIRSLIRAVERVTDHADELRQGRLGARVDVGTLPTELASLGHTLNDAGRALESLARRERQLREAERLSSIGLLVSGVAHELNNPLAIILMTSEEMVQQASDGASEGAAEILSQARRAREIVRRLLSVVRDQGEDEGRAVDPGRALADCREELAAVAAAGGCDLSFDVAVDAPAVLGGPEGLRIVATNLVTNAVDACGSAGHVSIALEGRDDGAVLTVEDDGPGVPAELRGRIFDPFVTTRSQDGHPGLGLSVVHGFLRRIGGSIHVEQRDDGHAGARFVACFPGVHATAETAPGRGTLEPGASIEPADGPDRSGPVGVGPDAGSARILVVDDEEPIRRMLRKLLERQGWSVDEAADGREALRMVREAEPVDPYALVVTDLKMPVMSGVELVDRLTAEVEGIERRVLVITGDNVAAGPAQFLERTGLPVVDKPFEVQELLDAVGRALAAGAGSTDGIGGSPP